jgi:hypothetical protein
MIDAIRTSGGDPTHMITENSGFPGNGFDPSVVGPQTSLDYLSVHDYPGSTPASTATTCASDGVATLSSALVKDTTYNNTTNQDPVQPTTTDLPDSSTITITSGSNSQAFTVNNGGAVLPLGSTDIPVTDAFGRPVTANFSYPTTSTVVDSAGCDAALSMAHTFQVGKPLIIEEVYDQGNANEQQMTQFLTGSSADATGWAGFEGVCSPLEVSNPPGSCGDILQLNMIFTKIWLSAMDTDKLPLGNALP